MWKSVAAVTLAVALSGCANYRAVSEFGERTGELTGTVRKEIAQVDALCVEQAALNLVLTNDTAESALKDCDAYAAAQNRFARVTIDVLDNYARALKAIADDKRFDLDDDLQHLAGKVGGLKDKTGKPLVGASEAGALSKVVEVLADIATTRKRDEAVKRLVAETSNLRTTGDLLRRYFTGPYANIVGVIGDTAQSNKALLANTALRKEEPIRTLELVRASREGRQRIDARRPGAPEGVQAKVVAAIDAWQEALQSFSRKALQPDAKELGERLKDLRKTVKAAYQAIETARH